MERFFKHALFLFTVLFSAALITVTGCSDDDNPTDPNGNGNNDTTTITDQVRPVVFVHGFLEAADVYTQMTQLFMLNGYTENQLYAFDLENYLSGSEPDIAEMATQVGAMVDAAIAASGESRVDIVAHGAGVEAVQQYLVNMSGTDKLAHVVFAGGQYDLSLTVNGDVTPSPCAYMTLRSDGKDDLQNGNAGYGELNGAENVVMAGYDNLQLVTRPESFARVFEFFTGSAPSKTTLDSPKPGKTYSVKARVINFIDNTPVAGVSVKVVDVATRSSGAIERQSGSQSFITDADGYFSFDATLGPNFHTEFWIQNLVDDHYDMHTYVQAWRADVQTLRLRLVPKSGGSSLLTQFSSAIRTGNHAVFFVYSQNEVLEASDDNLSMKRFNPAFEEIGTVSLLTPGNAPAPGASATAGNTFMLAVLDYNMDQQDGTGPIQTPGLNGFGMNSFDAYLIGSPTNHQTQVTLNGRTIGTQNFASKGGLGASNSGFTMVHFEY